eukprot:365745-Chlamydomonas_euryale.AAC.6
MPTAPTSATSPIPLPHLPHKLRRPRLAPVPSWRLLACLPLPHPPHHPYPFHTSHTSSAARVWLLSPRGAFWHAYRSHIRHITNTPSTPPTQAPPPTSGSWPLWRLLTAIHSVDYWPRGGGNGGSGNRAGVGSTLAGVGVDVSVELEAHTEDDVAAVMGGRRAELSRLKAQVWGVIVWEGVEWKLWQSSTSVQGIAVKHA